MFNLSVSSKWRNIVEQSCMMNNDEIIFYSDREILFEDDLKKFGNHWDEPRLVLSRPVFDFEIQEGLDFISTITRDPYGEEEEIVPSVTQFLDAFFKIKQQAVYMQELMKDEFDASVFLSNYIAGSYYDCMSGGFPLYELLICRYIAQDNRINKDKEVYPAGENIQKEIGREWYNIQDFLNETNYVEEKNKEEFKQLIGGFSFPLLSAPKN
jgi:hypothetical protein